MLAIRCFGDAVLCAPTQKVDFTQRPDLQGIITKMKATHRDKGGVGIAANQCADIAPPAPSIIIVGVMDEITRSKAQLRYPNIEIPDAKVMINPIIIERSPETYFPTYGEGCLSVPCTLRGKLARHRAVVLQYQDIDGQQFTTQFTDLFAHIVQHECDHLNGIVFMMRIIQDMSREQRQQFVALIDDILADPYPADQRPTTPTVALDRDEAGFVLIKSDLIKKTLADLEPTVLLALRQFCL